MQKILLVEDSLETQMVVNAAVGKSFQIKSVTTIAQALIELQTQSYNLVLLDVELPDGSGFQLCAQLRLEEKNKNCPVIFLTGRKELNDKILGFSLGADDYVVKPFDPLEFRARIESKMKRFSELEVHAENYVKGIFRVSTSLQKIFVKTPNEERDLILTNYEFKLLYYFLRHQDHVVSRDKILDEVWGQDTHVTDRTVDTHIYTLRQKLLEMSSMIITVPRAGYKFSQDESLIQKTA